MVEKLKTLNPFRKINGAFMSMLNHITGFKSSCVTFCYVAFLFIVLYAMTSVFILYFLGGAIPTFVVHTDMVKDFYIPIVQASATLFGIAITAIFGATWVDKNKDDKQPQG